jgi:D-sedoheptulose 7-phosphate isomerase
VELVDKVRKAKRVYIIGNGGSYANTMHMQNDSYSASANDYGHEFVFSRWVMLHGEPGDLLIAMSGSGKSPNILNAIGAAKILGMDVHLIFGNERGEDMQQAEESQISIGHKVMKALRA